MSRSQRSPVRRLHFCIKAVTRRREAGGQPLISAAAAPSLWNIDRQAKKWVRETFIWNRETSYINALYLVSVTHTIVHLSIFQRLFGSVRGRVRVTYVDRDHARIVRQANREATFRSVGRGQDRVLSLTTLIGQNIDFSKLFHYGTESYKWNLGL